MQCPNRLTSLAAGVLEAYPLSSGKGVNQTRKDDLDSIHFAYVIQLGLRSASRVNMTKRDFNQKNRFTSLLYYHLTWLNWV
jgi:hypothetical protein